MDTNTIIIIIAIFAAQAIPVALFLHLYKKMDDLRNDTNKQFTDLIKETNRCFREVDIRFHNLITEMNKGFKELGVKNAIIEERLNSTNIRIDNIKEHSIQIEDTIKDLTDKV